MGKPESESSRIPLRKKICFSLRFGFRHFIGIKKKSGKHACLKQKNSGKPAGARSTQTSTRKPDDSPPPISGPCSYLRRGGPSLAEFMRTGRKIQARRFRRDYCFDDSLEERVYINYKGDKCTWKDRSDGCTWVAIHGKKSICVALMGRLEMVRFRTIWQFDNGHILFAANVLSEIEDVAVSNEDSGQTMDKPVEKPFAVVKIGNVHQESGYESSGAIAFLKERMSSGLAFTHEETIQTAISALLRVFSNKELKANEIWGCMMEKDGMIFLQQEKIVQQLSVIKKSLLTDAIEKPPDSERLG